MKTIEDLKRLVSENKGELKIGALIFKWDGKDDSDIDVSLNDDLVMWFGSGNKDTDSLTDDGAYTVSSNYTEMKAQNQKYRNENRALEVEFDKLQKQVGELQEKLNKSGLADGKAAAYERVLFEGRKITIENDEN